MAIGTGIRLQTWLSRPYPLWRGAWPETRFAVAATALVTAIVYVARPFGLAGVPASLIVQLGIASLAASLVLRVGMPALIERNGDASRWNVGRQLAWEVAEIVLVAVLLMAVLAWHGLVGIDAARVLSFIAITALCAAVPVIVRILAMERWLRRRNEAQAARFAAAPSTGKPDAGLCIRTVEGILELASTELRFVRAEENYVDVVFVREGERAHRLLRATLSDIERQLDASGIVRCHRSYLVAVAAIADVLGNAQGFRLSLRDVAETVPVSRSRARAVLALIGQADRHPQHPV